jgi:hypothetical protein
MSFFEGFKEGFFERRQERWKMLLLHCVCFAVWNLIAIGIVYLLLLRGYHPSDSHMIEIIGIGIAYVLTGTLLYLVILRKSDNAEVQAIGWLFLTNPMIYSSVFDQKPWVIRNRIF